MWHKHWRYCCYFTLGSFTLWACLIPIASSRSWIAAKHGCWRYSPCTTQRAREIPNSQYLLSKIPKKKNQITMQHIYAKPKSKMDVTDPHPSSTSLSIFSFLSLILHFDLSPKVQQILPLLHFSWLDVKFEIIFTTPLSISL